jgi:hypothetical protein
VAVSPLQDPPRDIAPNARVVITKVFVRGLKVEAEVGVYSHERGKTQPLVIDVELDVAAAGAQHLSATTPGRWAPRAISSWSRCSPSGSPSSASRTRG